MKTIKIIDLLNKIAKGEEVPKKIKYDTIEYFFRNYDYKETLGKYIDEQSSFIEKIDFYKLNDEVEIIEEDEEIERIKWDDKSKYEYAKKTDEMLMHRTEQLKKSLNELIDVVNKLKNKED